MGEMKNMYEILVGKPEGRKQLGRLRRRWEDNTRTDPREIGWEGVDWIHLAQDRHQRREIFFLSDYYFLKKGSSIGLVKLKFCA
jgi:hypothetical protein